MSSHDHHEHARVPATPPQRGLDHSACLTANQTWRDRTAQAIADGKELQRRIDLAIEAAKAFGDAARKDRLEAYAMGVEDASSVPGDDELFADALVKVLTPPQATITSDLQAIITKG